MIIGSKLFFQKNLPSTNSFATSLITKNKAPDGMVIYTDYQSAGRGQAGNIWESEANKNLLISIVLYPSMINPSDQFLISMAVSVGICDFLRRFTTSISIKWPNDIYVNNDKIAGILIENSIMGNLIEHTIAGIGLNINQVKFLGDAPNPVSLANLTGKQYDLNDCLDQLVADLDRRYKFLIAGDFDRIKSDYLSGLYRYKLWKIFRDREGLFTGQIVGVGDSGCLQVVKRDGNVNDYSFKEIEFISDIQLQS